MEINLPVARYYSKNFTDPLYVPYQKTYVEVEDEWGKMSCPVYRWPQQGSSAFVNPALVKVGWGKSFQRKHPRTSCPPGYTEGAEGWCMEVAPDFESAFYKEKQMKHDYTSHVHPSAPAYSFPGPRGPPNEYPKVKNARFEYAARNFPMSYLV
jgi:hypothetical protein